MEKSTLKYILKRLAIAVVTLFVIVFVLFMILKLMPGTPFNDEKLTETQKAAIYAAYGLDKPLLEQFFIYVSNMLKGDFGISYAIQRNMSVSGLVGPRIGVSFALGIGATIIGTIIGFLLGIVAALKPFASHPAWSPVADFACFVQLGKTCLFQHHSDGRLVHGRHRQRCAIYPFGNDRGSWQRVHSACRSQRHQPETFDFPPCHPQLPDSGHHSTRADYRRTYDRKYGY